MTKQEIKEKGIMEYYIIIDEMNDYKVDRCISMRDVKRACREYDKECDGEWIPLLFKYSRITKEMTYIDEWSY